MSLQGHGVQQGSGGGAAGNAATTRMRELSALVSSRMETLASLATAHASGDAQLWQRCAVLQAHDIEQNVPEDHRAEMCERLAMVGYSIGAMLHLPNGLRTLQAARQLVYEHSIYMEIRFVESSFQPTAKTGPTTGLPDPELHRSGDTIFLQVLKLPRFALRLDYCSVVASFCRTLSQLYAKLLDDGVMAFESSGVALERLDASFAKLALREVLDNLYSAAAAAMREDFATVGELMQPCG